MAKNGPHSGKGLQQKTVTYNAHYAKHGKPSHPGMSSSKKNSAK